MALLHSPEALRRQDLLLLGVFCGVLFGYSLIGGRSLTMHEAVLPQSAREMLADGDWIVPKSGGRPWLERPPLPQWITVAIASLVGRCDQEWIVRIGPALMGTFIILALGAFVGRQLGRRMGLLSGICLATMFQFTRYSWLAEQDIFLSAIVTSAVLLFGVIEFQTTSTENEDRSFLGKRSRLVLGLFAVLATTNLAKGLLFGTVMAALPMAGFLLWNRDWSRIARYVWLWGWALYGVTSVLWPIASMVRYPDVVDLWWFDLAGRLSGEYTDINQPAWYYLTTLPWVIAPWTPLALVGLWQTRKVAFGQKYSFERFLWCWAMLPPLVFSFASGKHHHYLLQCIAPWAILAAFGLVWLQEKVVSLGHPLRRVQVATAGFIGVVVVLYCVGYTVAGRYFDQCRHDTKFLKGVATHVPAEAPVFACEDPKALDAFRLLFYLPPKTTLLHNTTFLLDESIPNRDLYLVTRYGEIERLLQFADVEVLTQSEYSRRAKTKNDLLTLFKVRVRPDVARYPGSPRVSPMQAMGREPGPYLGRPL
ncbi:MAG: glycosyltransferase family 39 protein [Planctomycetota bacterium]